MSITRDTYAKQLRRCAEAALYRNESACCPHEDCGEPLNVVRQSMLSTRSLFCPVHGLIFQEQEIEPFSKLDWETASKHATPWTDDEEEDDGNIEATENYN